MASKLRAIAGLAAAQIRHYRGRTVLAVVGVAVAVALVVLLAGLGHGVTTAGTSGLDWLDQDLWVAGGSLGVAPGSVGGVDNPIVDAHEEAERIESRADVETADAMAFQSVYASPNGSNVTTLVGVGVTGRGERISGDGFSTGDVRYANGSYDGPMTREVLVDERTAELYNVSVGDTLHLGGTVADARDNEFEVVGVSSTFSTFLGTPTVVFHLGELQTLTGTTGTDPASLVTVRTAPDADATAVERRLEREYPQYDVRTNREQLGAVVGNRATTVASVATLVVLAVVAGAALTANVLALLVHHQRRELAALRATGVGDGTLVGTVAGQSIGIGAAGGAVGCLAAAGAAPLLNALVADLTGFAALIKLPWWIFLAGLGLALGMGVVGAATAGWRVVRLRPLAHLRE